MVRSRWVLAYYSTERETGSMNFTSWKTKNWGNLRSSSGESHTHHNSLDFSRLLFVISQFCTILLPITRIDQIYVKAHYRGRNSHPYGSLFACRIRAPSNCILGAHEHLYDDIRRICGNRTMGKSSKVP